MYKIKNNGTHRYMYSSGSFSEPGETFEVKHLNYPIIQSLLEKGVFVIIERPAEEEEAAPEKLVEVEVVVVEEPKVEEPKAEDCPPECAPECPPACEPKCTKRRTTSVPKRAPSCERALKSDASGTITWSCV